MIRGYMRRLRGISYEDWTGEIGSGLEFLKLPNAFPLVIPGDLPERYETNWSPEEVLRDWIGTLAQKGLLSEEGRVRAKLALDWYLIRELARAIAETPNGIDRLEADIEAELRAFEGESAAAIGTIGELLIRDPMPTEEAFSQAHRLVSERIRINRLALHTLREELRDKLLSLRDKAGGEFYETLFRLEGEIETETDRIRSLLAQSKDSLSDDISYTREEVLTLLYRAQKVTL